MDERRFNVVFKGEIHEQATLSLVQERLATIFKVDVEKIKVMFTKKRTIVKKNAPWEVCLKVEQGFLNSGAYIDIEEVFPEGYEPVPIQYGPPPGYEPQQDYEYASESEYEYAQDSEYAPEAEYLSPPEPEVVNPEPEIEAVSTSKPYSAEPVMPESISRQPLRLEDEPEIVPEPEEYEEEPSLGYAPMPLEELMPEEDLIPEDEPEFEDEGDSEPEFEIVEDEDDSDLETTTEIEIVGLEPVIEHESEFEDDSYIDPEYEFDDAAEEVVEEDLNSFEMENIDLLPKAESENPYAAPLAKLTLDDDLSNKSNFVAPQKLPLKNGLSWLTNGFKLFRRNPFTWSFSVFIYFLISAIVGLIPLLGAIATNIFNPVFLAGFMLGAKEQAEGGKYRIGHIFAGISNNTGQLVLFGLLYIIVALAIFALMAIAGVSVFAFYAMKSGTINLSDPAIFASLANISPLIMILFVLVVMLITIPIMMAYYFGPALISINQASVFYAAQMSFRACLINFFPFLLYGLACLGVFAGIAIVVGGVAFLVGMLFETMGIFVGIIGMFVVMFATMPIFLASTYVAYKDIFYIK